jgi:hypothetical protein
MSNQLIGTVALIVVLIVLFILNFRFLRLWLNILRKKNGFADHKKVLSGAVGWVYIGGIFVSVGIVEMLLEGKEWYEGLFPLSASSQGLYVKSENLFPLMGYAFVGLGIILWGLRKRNKNAQER